MAFPSVASQLGKARVTCGQPEVEAIGMDQDIDEVAIVERGCGRERVGWGFVFAATAYNLTRLPKRLAQAK